MPAPTFHVATGKEAGDAGLFIFPFFEADSPGRSCDVAAPRDALTPARRAREMTGVPFELWWSPVADGAQRARRLGAGPRDR